MILSIFRTAARKCISIGDRSVQQNVRESMAIIGKDLPTPFYRTIQRFLTWLTGKALPGQLPAIMLGPWSHVVLNTLVLCVGIYISYSGFTQGGACCMLIPLGWFLTVHATRKFFLVICHAGIHGVFSKHEVVNRIFVDTVSLVILTLPYKQFKKDHSIDHHARYFSGKGDPDADVLYSIGLRPGRSLESLWLCVALALVNPLFHIRYIYARARANFVTATPLRRVLAIVIWLGAAYLVTATRMWSVCCIAWLLPLTIGFQNAALLTFAGEHKWFNRIEPGQRKIQWMQKQTSARFMGRSYPAPMGQLVDNVVRIIVWWLQMLCWFMPLRLLVVPGDMPVHDYHHSNPRGDWTNTLYKRSEWISEGAPLASETWGFCAAVNNALRPMSQIPFDYIKHTEHLAISSDALASM